MGASGLNSLVSVTTDDGMHCPTGGERIDVGTDTNQNNQLDPTEIQHTTYVCNGSAATHCGDGHVDAGEACDDGGESGSCNIDCTLAVCGDGIVNHAAGEQCDDGGEAGSCNVNCTLASCGDGIVNQRAGEECDDGNLVDGDGCSARCEVESAGSSSTCGNGAREVGEQCDDGNLVNLDGCSATCTFEQDQRVNSLTIQTLGDSTCPADAFGGALAPSATASAMQQAMLSSIMAGTTNVLFAFSGIADLTGTNDASFSLGVLTGTPVNGTGYNGAHDLDWWYTSDPNGVDANRQPNEVLTASILNQELVAGPASLAIPLFDGKMNLVGATLRASIGASSLPLLSTGTPPGHLSTEALDPNLASFASLGSNGSGGTLCGAVTAASLAAAPIPTSVLSDCSAYTSANTLLDLVVGGCTFINIVPVVNPTQPDTANPSAPIVGSGQPYRLTRTTNAVDGCKDKTGATVPFHDCLSTAAYSAYFKFTSDRVIVK